MVFFWMGKSVDELTREELIEVIEHLSSERDSLRTDRNRWMKAGDAAKYLLNI
jgi:hypothetical protein